MNPVSKIPRLRITSPLLSGLVNALIWMLLGALLFSLLLAWSGMKEQSLASWAYIIHAVASLAGGWSSGRKAGTKGWYHGGLLGLIYSFLIVLSGFLGVDAPIDLEMLLMPAVALGSGMLGGIVGVNTKK